MKIVFVGNFEVPYSSENHHKQSLESLGHEVIALQEGKTSAQVILSHAEQSDLLVWVHTHNWNTEGAEGLFSTLKAKGTPTLTYHLDLWLGLERQKDLETDPFYKSIGWFFTVDKLMADWFNKNTSVKGRYLQAGVFDEECYMLEGSKKNDVIFVGSKGYHPEWSYRPKLIDWLDDNYANFVHAGGDGKHLPTTRGRALNQLYADSKIAIGDSLCINFDYPYYWSDRVYETMGRGGFIIHPYIKGMEEHFQDGKHLIFYEFNDFEDLKWRIDYYLSHDDEREAIRLAGHEHVKKNHTYKNRWEAILKEVFNV